MEDILRLLIQIKADMEKEPSLVAEGICNHAWPHLDDARKLRMWVAFKQSSFVSWPKFSGIPHYPIRVDKSLSDLPPEHQFDLTGNSNWEHQEEFIKLRLELLDYLIERAEAGCHATRK